MGAPKILMVAAENDGLVGAKVGGIADVVRDIAPALADRGCAVDVLLPSHGFLHRQQAARALGQVVWQFAGRAEEGTLLELDGRRPHPGVRQLVLHHPGLGHPAAHGADPPLYWNDGDDRPFASDAIKFARFAAATTAALRAGQLGAPDVIHCHDWHAGTVLALLRYDPLLASLRSVRTVYTIHNLALQGIRPLRDDASSLAAWFPHLDVPPAEVADPRYLDSQGAPLCYNPMRAGIRLADRVQAVSPTYAREILRPTVETVDDQTGERTVARYGGMGLEADLQAANAAGRLAGILNGTVYDAPPAPADWPGLVAAATAVVQAELQRDPAAADHALALARLAALADRPRPAVVVTSVTRITDQKADLMVAGTPTGPALGALLTALGDHGVYLLCGQGQPRYEQELIAMAARHPNFIFLRGFSPALADRLYAAGDLFLMPSSFEPCGISQMMALRAGQPCLVHGVGGLRDTVEDGVTGFVFEGETRADQAAALVACFDRALRLFLDEPARYTALRQAAAAARFTWSDAAAAYLAKLYADD